MAGMIRARGDDLQADRDLDCARVIAAARAHESMRGAPLVRDPEAGRLAGARGVALLGEAGGDWLVGAVAVRTKWLDDQLATLLEPRSLVISLGAGLDTRPFRLALDPRTTWVEVDREKVLAHKERSLPIQDSPVDLRRIAGDVPSALRPGGSLARVLEIEGTDSRSTVWILEGLLAYLEPDAAEATLRAIARATPRGVVLADIPSRATVDGDARLVLAARKWGVPFKYGVVDVVGALRGAGLQAELVTHVGAADARYDRIAKIPPSNEPDRQVTHLVRARPDGQAPGHEGRPLSRAPAISAPRPLDALSWFYDTDYVAKSDVARFLRLISTQATVLELGCGTGRVVVPLAERGNRVIAVDTSKPMLDELRSKLARAEDRAVAARVRIVHRDIVRLRDVRADAAILAFNTFSLLGTAERQAKALHVVRSSLRRRGVIAIDVTNPLSLDLRGDDHARPGPPRRDRAGVNYIQWAKRGPMGADQRFAFEGWYQREGEGERHAFAFVARMVFSGELCLMLESAGFRVVSIDGGTEGDAWHPSSPRLFVVAQRTG